MLQCEYMKKCPNDNTPLETISLKGVKVDSCPKDGGLWFDHDELGRAKDAADEDLRWFEFDLFEDSGGNKYTKYKTDKKCPKDNSEMISLEYQNSGVRIDKCILCNGVWLEKGEFDKIIAYLDKKVNEMSAGELGRDALKELSDLAQGTDDVGEELKDLLTLLKLYEVRLEAEHPTAESWVRNLIAYWPIH